MSAREAAEFETSRPRLFSLAYRLLGSAAEAEDAVQDAYLRWHAADRAAIESGRRWPCRRRRPRPRRLRPAAWAARLRTQAPSTVSR
ncbi:sigma factor [Nonomuraea africana]|uniref:sigma factor n=1 Tax=Nonomuraea africana TaxID=46171 RepID=UPI0037B48DA0